MSASYNSMKAMAQRKEDDRLVAYFSMKVAARLRDAGKKPAQKRLFNRVTVVSRFNDIPIELHRMIALLCENDRDLVTYGSLTKDTFNAVFSDGGIWRLRFNDKFDYPHGTALIGGTSAAYEKEYKYRMENIAKSKLWQGFNEDEVIKVVTSLIRESFHAAPGKKMSLPFESKNMEFVKELVRKLGVLDNFSIFVSNGGRINDDDLVYNAVRLALFPWTFNRSHMVWGSEASRDVAFASLGVEPLFYHGIFEINHTFLLHVCNFFSVSCSSFPDYGIGLSSVYHHLSASDKPQIWSRPLKQGVQAIGNAWLGVSAQMDANDRERVLQGEDIGAGVGLEFINEDEFDVYDIEMSDPNNKATPKLTDFFENLIQTLPSQDLLRHMKLAESQVATHLPFHGLGCEGDGGGRFELIGNVYALPEQAGIPGWQRIAFLKYWPVRGRGKNFEWLKYNTLWECREDTCELLAYEGILLPGNKVMVGRWFQPNGPRPEPTDDWQWDCDAGPEVIWCTDEDEIEQCKSELKELPIEIAHSSVGPRPNTLPKPPTGMEWLWDDEMRLPPPSKDLKVKKAKWGLLFRREEWREIKHNLTESCSLAKTPIDVYLYQGLPTAKSSSFEPQEQYRKMMDLWEADKNLEKTESYTQWREKRVDEELACERFKFAKEPPPSPPVSCLSESVIRSIYSN